MEMTDWADENPFYLLIAAPDAHVVIDLGESGWATKHAAWMRRAAKWHLAAKGNNRILMSVNVLEGDQPYYTARHLGAIGSAGSNEIICYGIGKKQANGEMVRLWLMPNGVIVGGDDVDPFGMDIIYTEGPVTD